MQRIVEFQSSIDLERLEDSTHLLDILVQCENVLDSLDIYVYRNWYDGEIVKGPNVRRHWVTFDLAYPYDKMPDPRAALRLLKHGVQVEFNKIKRVQPGSVDVPDHEPSKPTDWLVTITVPRRLLDATKEADLDTYEDEINPDDVTSAKDIGLDDQSTYQQDEQAPDMGNPMNVEQPPMGQGMPPGPQGAPNAPVR